MVLGFERSHDVGVGDRVRDLRGLVRVQRSEAQGQNVSRQHALDFEVPLDGPNRATFDALLRGGATRAEQREHLADDQSNHPGLGAVKFRILCEFQASDDRQEQIIGVDDLDLAVHIARVDQRVRDGAVLVQNLGLTGIHQDPRVRRVHRRRRQQIEENKHESAAGDRHYQRPLPAQDIEHALGAQRRSTELEAVLFAGLKLISGLIHLRSSMLLRS